MDNTKTALIAITAVAVAGAAGYAVGTMYSRKGNKERVSLGIDKYTEITNKKLEGERASAEALAVNNAALELKLAEYANATEIATAQAKVALEAKTAVVQELEAKKSEWDQYPAQMELLQAAVSAKSKEARIAKSRATRLKNKYEPEETKKADAVMDVEPTTTS